MVPLTKASVTTFADTRKPGLRTTPIASCNSGEDAISHPGTLSSGILTLGILNPEPKTPPKP